jgi:hypothetical protein
MRGENGRPKPQKCRRFWAAYLNVEASCVDPREPEKVKSVFSANCTINIFNEDFP